MNLHFHYNVVVVSNASSLNDLPGAIDSLMNGSS